MSNERMYIQLKGLLTCQRSGIILGQSTERLKATHESFILKAKNKMHRVSFNCLTYCVIMSCKKYIFGHSSTVPKDTAVLKGEMGGSSY